MAVSGIHQRQSMNVLCIPTLQTWHVTIRAGVKRTHKESVAGRVHAYLHLQQPQQVQQPQQHQHHRFHHFNSTGTSLVNIWAKPGRGLKLVFKNNYYLFKEQIGLKLAF